VPEPRETSFADLAQIPRRLTPEEAAFIAGVSAKTIREWAAAIDGLGVKVVGRWAINEKNLRVLLRVGRDRYLELLAASRAKRAGHVNASPELHELNSAET
jgi:hypothetical protein